jgi:hypothetical protein
VPTPLDTLVLAVCQLTAGLIIAATLLWAGASLVRWHRRCLERVRRGFDHELMRAREPEQARILTRRTGTDG